MYFYNASGQKVQKVVTENTTVTTTDYLGGYQYQNLVLQFFPTAEGYLKNTPVSGTNSYSYVFNYTDHLGNTRLSYTKDAVTGSLKILEESNYYPFGLKHNSYNVDNFQQDYKYKYNGKELQDELSLNLYDYGARNYDPALGRWMNVDPLEETSRRFSSYVYALNNPVLFIDPDGMEAKGADGLTNSEWLAANRRIDSPTAKLDAEQKEFDKKQAEIDFYANKIKKKSIVTVGDAEVLDSGLNHAMYKIGDDYGKPKPPKFRWRHLLGPDALYVAGAEDLGIGIGVGFEHGVIIILRGKDAGIYPAQDFGIGASTASGSLSVEAVKLYYSGDTVTKDVFYGNRYEANFGADVLGHIGFTGVYAPMKDGNMVWGYGITLGVGFSATIFSGNINYGRTQTNWDSMIPSLVKKK